MARIFDVIEYPNEMQDEIVHRFPEVGAGDFHIGSQVIVRESQNAVFFRDGNALDVFGPGRHTITTANIPLLINLVGKLFNDKDSFSSRSVFCCHARVCRSQMGHPPADYRTQPEYGPWGSIAAGFWHVQLPGQRSATIYQPGGRRSRGIPHHGYRKPAAFDAAFKTARSPRRNCGKAQRTRTHWID